jgi:peptide methionine sulfoxide reductase msrA/msrB
MKRLPMTAIAVAAAATFAFAATLLPVSLAQHDKQPEELPTMTTEQPQPRAYSKSGHAITPLTQPQIDKLAEKLSADEAAVILNKGTEPAFCGRLVDNHKEGVYVCRLCGLPLFSSDAKFDSGTGWPSFFQPVDHDHLRYEKDDSYGMKRTEITCTRCGAHLGHVFDDGPKPTKLRYCLNSVSLQFFENNAPLPAESQPVKLRTAYFAGGCFWGVEDLFQQLPGVIDATSGYMGGQTENPTYEEVCSHTTGHAETVKVIFDPATITYRDLLAWFIKLHDPTQLNRQGADYGDNYRSAIFASSPEQFEQAKAFIAEQQQTDRFKNRTIVTQLQSTDDAGPFYRAEDDHQDYHLKHGGACPLPQR